MQTPNHKLCLLALLPAFAAMTACDSETDLADNQAIEQHDPAESDSPVHPELVLEAETPEDLVLASVALKSGNTFKFVALPNAANVIEAVGVLEEGFGGGGAALPEFGVDDLSPLDMFYALTDDDAAAPAALELLYDDGGETRGWLKAAIEDRGSERAAYSCSNSWFLARHGDLQTGYDYHDGPEDGAWLDWYVGGSSSFAWYRFSGIDKVKLGVCVQDQGGYSTSDIRFRYLPPGGSWTAVVDNDSVPTGYYYWWYCNSCTNYGWQEHFVPDYDYAVYDIGYDWST